ATLSCAGCAVGTIVNYAIAEGTTPIAISQILSATVDIANGKIVLPVSLVQRATPGDHTYQIVVTATGIGSGGTAQVNSATLNAVDLGRVPPPSP
ncbi:MAG: hypothetical protein KY439_09380, partial [Actinobacteria bacterium]|nr:hypothetical protein [Actinomycetota bacterium]